MIQILFNVFKKRKPIISSFQKYKKHFENEQTTFIDKNSKIRFDVPDKIEDRKYVKIGAKGIINANFIFESERGEVIIGDNVHLGSVTFISRNRIIIKNDVTMAWGITIYDHNSHSIYWNDRKNDNEQSYRDYISSEGNTMANKDWSCVLGAPITIESKVWIGFDVLILKGVTIGEGSVVAAKSVVTKNVEAWTVVAGNPAVVVKYLPEYRST
ncbi:acyltransferase [Flavobacterium restrictum]|uniref:Acyltransferase n=1 Tax=Flavobacterium restrictum TaxID=2594428 RepID=A0A553E8K6_9FLAO|nr:acyltransferase [Flavobacterium restrictum]TRX41241.1 acyltransferase [Flavobacterium restrictum]